MGTDNVVFLEVIEWFDKTGKEIVHRIPQKGSGEIKFGARLIVREIALFGTELVSRILWNHNLVRYK